MKHDDRIGSQRKKTVVDQPQTARRYAAPSSSTRAARPEASASGVRGRGYSGGAREGGSGATGGGGATDRSALQDVGDIVQAMGANSRASGGRGQDCNWGKTLGSLGSSSSSTFGDSGRVGDDGGDEGRAAGNRNGTSLSASQGGAAAPLGLLDALKASATSVSGNTASTTRSSIASSSQPLSGGAEFPRDTDGRRTSGAASEGGGWESIPLSQRLAAVNKSAGPAPRAVGESGTGGGGGRDAGSRGSPGFGRGAKEPQQQQQQQQRHGQLLSRANGLAGGRALNDSLGSGKQKNRGSDCIAEEGNRQDGVKQSNDDGTAVGASDDMRTSQLTREKLAGVAEEGERLTQKNMAIDRSAASPAASAPGSQQSLASRQESKAGRSRQLSSTDRAGKPETTGVGTTPAPATSQAGAQDATGRASTRRQELASFLADLKKNVAPGAYDVFRSRAKTMKVGEPTGTENERVQQVCVLK